MISERLVAYRGDVPFKYTVPVLQKRGLARDGLPSVAKATLKLEIGPGRRGAATPLVSCLMPTKDRFLQAKFAISCFLRQSWPTKELVILDQSADDRLIEWLGALNNPQLKWHSLRGTREPLGAIRNHAVELARGAFVCVWDDDDLQHPARIELAMASMAATKSVASVLAREIFWAPMRRGIGVLPMRPHENSLLAARAIMPRYANVARKEDVATVSQILRQQSLLLIDLPELYVYVAHGQNTCDEGLFNAIWDQDATDRRQGSAKDATLALLRQAFPIEDYEAFLRGRAAIRV